jgi:prefoldin subunit 5
MPKKVQKQDDVIFTVTDEVVTEEKKGHSIIYLHSRKQELEELIQKFQGELTEVENLISLARTVGVELVP